MKKLILLFLILLAVQPAGAQQRSAATVTSDTDKNLRLHVYQSLMPDRNVVCIDRDSTLHFSYTLHNDSPRTITGILKYVVVDDSWIHGSSDAAPQKYFKRANHVVLPAPMDSSEVTVDSNSYYQGQFTMNLSKANLVPNRIYVPLICYFTSLTSDSVKLVADSNLFPFVIQTDRKVIQLRTTRAVGDSITLGIKADGSYTVYGAKRASKVSSLNGADGYYYVVGQMGRTGTSQSVAVAGDVTLLDCHDDNIVSLDVTGDISRGWNIWACIDFDNQQYEKYSGNDATDIPEVITPKQDTPTNTVYDMNGRRISTTTSEYATSMKGLYIINGKKMTVK